MSNTEDRAPFVMLHALFESERPDEAAAEERYEQHRQATFIAVHGSLDGYRPPRRFPCPGALRIVDRTEHFDVVVCDECSYLTTFKRAGAPADPDPDAEMAW